MKRYLNWKYGLLLAIFIVSFVLMVFSAKSDSITTDEGVHLFAGYTYLTQKDFRLDPEHPPLLKELSAAPLLFFRDLKVNLDSCWEKAGNFYYDSWQEARNLGDRFLFENPDSILIAGRMVFIILTLILGLFGYFWANKIYGQRAGIFASFLILFFPTILAHGRLINTDIGVALFIFVSVYFWGKFLKSPSVLNGLLSGIFLGLVLSSKYTGVILVPILIVLAISKLVLQKNLLNLSKYILGFISVLIISFFVIWGSYFFTISAPPKINDPLSIEIMKVTTYNIPITYDNAFSKLRSIIIPKDFYKGFLLVGRHALGGQSSYLLGQTSNQGWWYYFPVGILFKTPIPIFIFFLLAIIYFRKAKSKDIFDEYLLIIPPTIFLAFSMYSKADLGVRHILPIFPFLLVFASKSINLINFKKINVWAIFFGILIVWYFTSAIMSFPNYIAYFNEFAGGSKGGYKIMTDSNLDWGQDVFRIKDYIQKNNLQNVYLVYNWDGDMYLEKYGIDFKPLSPGERNIKGNVIISASSYVGGDYNWLQKYPKTEITPGVFLVEVN